LEVLVKIERVEIARLREIPGGWPDLVIGDKGLVIYGPNGVGKSSIIDALEATIAGRSTLFANERTGVSWEIAAPHLGGGVPAVTIRGKLSGKPTELTLGRTPDSDLSDWIKIARTASFVLRRYMLLRFIDAQPKERYEQTIFESSELR
jgi:recombinational DNA repair ATPase RecF